MAPTSTRVCSMRPIQFLTPEQVAAIPEYQNDLQGLVKHCGWILA